MGLSEWDLVLGMDPDTIDSSCITTGFILLQLRADKKHYPSQFDAITWNERESCYSQAKIEKYGLWCASKHISVKNIQVEIDASYIKGMLNNPDIQPGIAVNRWIVSIKLFQLELVHVPGQLHTDLDSLSWHTIFLNDSVEEDDVDDWLNKTMLFAIILMNSKPSWASRLNTPYCPTHSSSHLLN